MMFRSRRTRTTRSACCALRPIETLSSSRDQNRRNRRNSATDPRIFPPDQGLRCCASSRSGATNGQILPNFAFGIAFGAKRGPPMLRFYIVRPGD